VYVVLVTTVVSGAHYLWSWTIMKDIEHDQSGESRRD
jgi:hypothetical protein